MEFSDRCRISTEVRVMYFDTDAGGVVQITGNGLREGLRVVVPAA